MNIRYVVINDDSEEPFYSMSEWIANEGFNKVKLKYQGSELEIFLPKAKSFLSFYADESKDTYFVAYDLAKHNLAISEIWYDKALSKQLKNNDITFKIENKTLKIQVINSYDETNEFGFSYFLQVYDYCKKHLNQFDTIRIL